MSASKSRSAEESPYWREVFFPYAAKRLHSVVKQKKRFVHYTTAEAARSALVNLELWMRKSTTMNDFQEVHHGLACLRSVFAERTGQRFLEQLEAISPGLWVQTVAIFDGWFPSFVEDTYIACFSEHKQSEDRTGRLSMWRAYGASTGVAIVFKNDAFASESDALSVYSSPVTYADVSGVRRSVLAVARQLEAHGEWLKTIPRDDLLAMVFTMLRFSVLCTKHPGFSEEVEWRAIFNPGLEKSPHIGLTIECVRGIPQPVAKIPLRRVSTDLDLSPNAVIDRLIIGPTQYASATREAFIRLLADAGVEEPAGKVFVSNIPLRC